MVVQNRFPRLSSCVIHEFFEVVNTSLLMGRLANFQDRYVACAKLRERLIVIFLLFGNIVQFQKTMGPLLGVSYVRS